MSERQQLEKHPFLFLRFMKGSKLSKLGKYIKLHEVY